MKFAPIIDPSVRKPSPKPVRVDLRKVFTFGTALWAIALVICMVLCTLRMRSLMSFMEPAMRYASFPQCALTKLSV